MNSISLEKQIVESLIKGFKTQLGMEVESSKLSLQETRKDFRGQYTLVVFPFTKEAGKSPEALASILGDYLVGESKLIAAYNVVKGFLNLEVKDSLWLSCVEEAFEKPDFGILPAKNETVMVEYSSPNTNKPLHLGHLRNNFLGFSVSQILEACGYRVIKANLVNDRGIHICKSMVAYQMFGKGEQPTSELKGDHLVGKYYVAFDKAYKAEIDALIATGMEKTIAEKEAPIMKAAQKMLLDWENGNSDVRDLWKMMNDWVLDGFGQTYKRMGVSFDEIYFESNTYLLGKEIIDEGLSKGVFFRKEDGSVWCDLTAEGLDQKLVLRKDGTSVYITQDLGTADLKFSKYGATRSVYVVGNEQDYHFSVLFKIMKKLGRPYSEGMFHLSYGMVELPDGKMKSREGNVVDADDLLAEMVQTAKERTLELGKTQEMGIDEHESLFEMLGVGAIKYFLLKVDPKSKMLFLADKSIELQGHTATFIQYSHARIKSILRKAAVEGVSVEIPISYNLTDLERELSVLLVRFPEIIEVSGKDYSPAPLANYIFEVAKTYNRLFAELSIFNADNEGEKQFRVLLSALTGKVIDKGMRLLGISVPDRM